MNTTGPRHVRVAVCIPTFRRPLLLEALLRSLASQTAAGRAQLEGMVIVVDNDDQGSERDVVEWRSLTLSSPSAASRSVSRAMTFQLLRRAFQSANGFARSECAMSTSKATAVTRGAKGIGRILQGLFLVVVSLGRGRIAFTRALQRVCVGLGAVAGSMGVSRDEYRTVHGR